MTADSIVPLRPITGTLPLYCVHPVSGSVFPYLPLAPLLEQEQPVYGLEAPGYDDDRPPVALLPELSAGYVEEIGQHAGGQPLCLLGWSMGGAIAYDMACRMRAAGRAPALVILVETLVPEPRPVPDDRLLLVLFAADLAGRADPDARRALDAVLGAAPGGLPGRPAEAFGALAAAGLIPRELDQETLSRRFALFRAHLAALYGYRAAAGYPGPVVAIRGERTSAVGRSWADVALDLTEHTVPGDHYSIWHEGLAELGAAVRRSLRRTRTALSGERTR